MRKEGGEGFISIEVRVCIQERDTGDSFCSLNFNFLTILIPQKIFFLVHTKRENLLSLISRASQMLEGIIKATLSHGH